MCSGMFLFLQLLSLFSIFFFYVCPCIFVHTCPVESCFLHYGFVLKSPCTCYTWLHLRSLFCDTQVILTSRLTPERVVTEAGLVLLFPRGYETLFRSRVLSVKPTFLWEMCSVKQYRFTRCFATETQSEYEQSMPHMTCFVQSQKLCMLCKQ